LAKKKVLEKCAERMEKQKHKLEHYKRVVSNFRARDCGFLNFLRVLRTANKLVTPSKIKKLSYIRKME
jgi:hypothetical protein